MKPCLCPALAESLMALNYKAGDRFFPIVPGSMERPLDGVWRLSWDIQDMRRKELALLIDSDLQDGSQV